MNEEAKKPSGPDPNVNPELFDDYDFREERKPTPESEEYYRSMFDKALGPIPKKGEDKPAAEPAKP
jgi:hypothetical protein